MCSFAISVRILPSFAGSHMILNVCELLCFSRYLFLPSMSFSSAMGSFARLRGPVICPGFVRSTGPAIMFPCSSPSPEMQLLSSSSWLILLLAISVDLLAVFLVWCFPAVPWSSSVMVAAVPCWCSFLLSLLALSPCPVSCVVLVGGLLSLLVFSLVLPLSFLFL